MKLRYVLSLTVLPSILISLPNLTTGEAGVKARSSLGAF